jgi:hypothetical protein
VYEQALGDEHTKLSHGSLIILTTNIFPYYNDAHSDKGVPTWILGNKQLCSEALSVFGKTRIFIPFGFQYYDPTNDPSPPPRVIFNSLVVNLNVINHVASQDIFLDNLRVVHRFLDVLRKFRAADLESGLSPKHLSAETKCVTVQKGRPCVPFRIQGIYTVTKWNPYWEKEGRFHLAAYANRWQNLVHAGEFHKVKLTVSHRVDEDSIPEAYNIDKYMKSAADCTAGLVAHVAQPIWGEWTSYTNRKGQQVSERTVVAERKV